MSEPQIQYTKTSDNVSIAYYAEGTGAPLLVIAPLGPSHLRLERRFPDLVRWYDHICEHRRLIRYDPRNAGLSDRRVTNTGEQWAVADIEAVLNALGCNKVDILAGGPSCFIGARFAAANPQSVRKFVMIMPVLRGSDFYPGEQGRAVLKLAETDWNLFVQTASHARFGWSSDQAHEFAEIWRESQLQEDFLRMTATYQTTDIRPHLALIKAETFVAYNTASQFARDYERAAREIASEIPGTRVFDWGDGSIYYMSNQTAIDAIDDFLGIPRMTFAAGEDSAPSGLATILFTDVEGSTALTDRLGDAAARELLREHERITRSALASYGGSEVKALGDGFMASFRSATGALDCAIALQREFWERGVASDHKDALRIRIGINAGEPVAEDGDLFGTSVNLAARIATQAGGGDILVSDVVRQLVAGKGYVFNNRGETRLRGFDDPVKLYEVKWRE